MNCLILTVFDLFQRLGWGSKVETERRIRIRLSLAALAYETDRPLTMTDAEFDALALQSDPSVRTGRLDDWWVKEFSPHTGQWVHTHPELDKLEKCYNECYT